MEMLAIPVVWTAVEIVAGKLFELGEIKGEELQNMGREEGRRKKSLFIENFLRGGGFPLDNIDA